MGWTRKVHAKWHVREWTNKWCMRGDVFTNGRPCEDVFVDERTEKHSKMCSRTNEQMNMHFREQTDMSSMPKYKQGAMCERKVKRTQWHQRLRTPCHAEVNLWYTMRTSITEQHCNLTCILAATWTYQHYHVKSCHESCRPHHYCGTYCVNQCNVTWKSKRPTCNLKSHESQTIMRKVEQWQGPILPLAINMPHLYM